MTKRIIVVCISLLLLLLALPVARAASVDSLRQALTKASEADKSEIYAQLSRELSGTGDAEMTLSLLEEWATYERERGDMEREGKVRWSKIATLSNFCLDDALLAEAPVQMSWFESKGQWENYYNTWECKASVYLYSNRVQTALHEAELMLHDAQQRDNDFGRVVSYQLTGMIYENMSQTKPAIENLDKALQLVKQQKSSGDIIFSVYDYLCQALDADEQYSRELEITTEWKAAIERFRQQKKFGPSAFRGADISRMVQHASALLGLGRTEEAAEILDEASVILSGTKNPVSNYKVFVCRTRLYLREEKPEQALACLDSLEQLGIEVGASMGKGKLIDEIFGEKCEGTYIQPTFITDYPVEMSPLCKRHRNNPELTERFELMVNGKELANAYTELNDPIDQRARFEEQMKLSERGDDEAMFIDQDFLRALEYGMPPTSGMGIGIDRFVMLLTGQTTIQEVLLFPMMRPEKVVKNATKEDFMALGMAETWATLLLSNGYNTVEQLKAEKPSGLREKLNGLRKKNKLDIPALQLEDVEAWLQA